MSSQMLLLSTYIFLSNFWRSLGMNGVAMNEGTKFYKSCFPIKIYALAKNVGAIP